VAAVELPPKTVIIRVASYALHVFAQGTALCSHRYPDRQIHSADRRGGVPGDNINS
jgi:hypothetical protein